MGDAVSDWTRGVTRMAMHWYVVHAYSGFENQVKRSLEDRVKRHNMADKFGQILVPTEEVVEMKDGQKRKSDRKFFPGYVLVEMEMDNDSWHLVKDCPKVMGFIGGSSDKPAPISAREAQAILDRIQEGVEKPRPKVLFEVGEMVRVIDGPFTDFNGVVEEVDDARPLGPRVGSPEFDEFARVAPVEEEVAREIRLRARIEPTEQPLRERRARLDLVVLEVLGTERAERDRRPHGE